MLKSWKAYKMANLKEQAQEYESPTTKNIADMDAVAVDVDLKQHTATKDDGTEFSYNYIEHNDEMYRVPNTVLKQLKEHIAAKPDLKTFKVSKKGEGLKTEYTVIPLE